MASSDDEGSEMPMIAIDFDAASRSWMENKVFDSETKLLTYGLQRGDDVYFRTSSLTPWVRGTVVATAHDASSCDVMRTTNCAKGALSHDGEEGGSVRIENLVENLRCWSTTSIVEVEGGYQEREMPWHNKRQRKKLALDSKGLPSKVSFPGATLLLPPLVKTHGGGAVYTTRSPPPRECVRTSSDSKPSCNMYNLTGGIERPAR